MPLLLRSFGFFRQSSSLFRPPKFGAKWGWTMDRELAQSRMESPEDRQEGVWFIDLNILIVSFLFSVIDKLGKKIRI
jgi:hypothetical protein